MTSKAPSGMTDEMDVDTAFICQMFKANYKGSGPLYSYKTCALDNENCKRIFLAVRDVAVRGRFDDVGL